MALSLLGNARLRSLIRRNAVSFPAQVRSFSRRAEGHLAARLAQLYFIRGWSTRALALRYGFSKAQTQKLLNEWRVRAIGSGYVQEIEPGSVELEMPSLARTLRDEARECATTAIGPVPESSRPVSDIKPPGKPSAGRILIVCNDQPVRQTLHSAFLDIGFETAEAENGDEVLALCRCIPYNAVLLDINTPGRAAVEICRELRALKPFLAILMLSDNSDHERNIDVLEAGADDYVTKPFRLGEVCARIRAALRHSRTAACPPNARLIVTSEDSFYSESSEALVIPASHVEVPRFERIRAAARPCRIHGTRSPFYAPTMTSTIAPTIRASRLPVDPLMIR